MQLTPEEAAEYKDAPVVYNGELGFFFEPNEYVYEHVLCQC
jgi:sarcosine oxidase/L-pipecolate oxidase